MTIRFLIPDLAGRLPSQFSPAEEYEPTIVELSTEKLVASIFNADPKWDCKEAKLRNLRNQLHDAGQIHMPIVHYFRDKVLNHSELDRLMVFDGRHTLVALEERMILTVQVIAPAAQRTRLLTEFSA